jgi:hypothetical protein
MGVSREFDLPRFKILMQQLNTADIDLIELGDQDLTPGDGQPRMKFRNTCRNQFKSWRTLDLWPTEGVEIFDLSIVSDEKDCADIITNYGTSEHVEPEACQYNCWVNIHNFLRVGGTAIHALPLVGAWEDHCRYYCNLDFFRHFNDYGYEIVDLQVTPSQLVYCRMIKREKKEFMSYEKFMQEIIFKNVDISKIVQLNNPKNLKW